MLYHEQILKNYFNKYKFKNTVEDNLWEELTEQAYADKTLDKSLDLKDIMFSWTLKKGYPVLQINRESDKLIMTQSYFLLNPLNKIKKENLTEYNQYRWYIPVTFTTQDELDFDFEKKPIWFKAEDDECNYIIKNKKNR